MSGAGSEFRLIEAGLQAQKVLKERGIDSLPVDPMLLAENEGILVQAKSADAQGVSGMLIRFGQEFCIAYATHIENDGFRRFSVAHELGHYFLSGHVDHVLPSGQAIHESRAGFVVSDPYELEADHFAARLLMPSPLFENAMSKVGTGLAAVKNLRDTCVTSLTATAIRYAQAADTLVATIVSEGKTIKYAFMSDELKEVNGIQWMRRNTPLPKNTATYEFNSDTTKVSAGKTVESDTSLLEWFTADVDVEMTEEIVGLGRYGRTLTILVGEELRDVEDEDGLEELTSPHFR